MSRREVHRIGGVGLLLLGLTGCASVNPRAGFPEVGAAVEERAVATIVWNRGTELDREAAAKLRALLARKLAVADAVQVAMLSNRDLQATYTELGVAQADLVQAGLFRNPIFDAAVLFPLSGVRPDLQFSVVVSFLDTLYVPLRKRVAAARFDEAKFRVTAIVLDLVGRVRRAFYRHQADEQGLALRRTALQALSASWEVSRRLHEAGNVTDLDLARNRAQMEAAKLALRSSELAARRSREELNGLMGLWGEQARWEVDRRLPDPPAEADEIVADERTAIARSLDLVIAQRRIVATGQQLGYERATALVPALDLGGEAEREEEWKVGPGLSVPIPLFDQGQARVGRAELELRRAQQEYYALAVRIRATTRAARERARGARDRALYYRDIVLPLQEQIVDEAQRQYNAMQLGVIQLLRDREGQIEAGVAYVEALREYWLARADLTQITSGRLPGATGGPVGPMDARGRAEEDVDGH